MSYGDRFTWAKYGHLILFSGLILKSNTEVLTIHEDSLTMTHRDCLLSFLWTDPDGSVSFVLDKTTDGRIDEFLKNTFQAKKGTEKGYFFDQFMDTNTDSIVSSICDIPKKATKIPLAIFMDLFHFHFKKKPYLESTLEILQQFYIELVDYSTDFSIFVKDRHKYCLKCTRCHCAITKPDYINCVLEIAPMAMLYHWEISTDEHVYPNCPVLFPNTEDFGFSQVFFEQSRDEKGHDDLSPFLRCNPITNHGMLRFCEATKVDLESWYNSKKTQNKTHNTIISSTKSLVATFFHS